MHAETHATWPLPAAELKPALELALALARADMTVLLLHDESVGALVPALGSGMDEEDCALIGTHRPGADPFGVALSEHRRVVVLDAPHEDAIARIAESLHFRSIEIVPLFGIDGHPVGEIAMMFRRSRSSSRRMTKLVEHCARLIVSTVMHARRRVEAERARETAEQVGRAKIQFFARMSHELRTPLQSIAGYIDLLRVGAVEPLTPSQARLLARVHDSEEILVHVIDDLITFSRLEAGNVSYHIDLVAAEEALRITQSVIAPLAADHGVTLDVGDCSGIFVSADGDKLKQILVNLTANAVKFSRKGGNVRVACRSDGDGVRFDVSDNGPGIPADKLREIFEPYVQLDTPLLDRFGGTGLGLTISREFAAGMHGQLTVASTVGSGSVFTLRLPRAKPDTVRTVRATRQEEAPPPS